LPQGKPRIARGIPFLMSNRREQVPFEYENLGTASGRQSGTYRGNRSAVHCHFVGGNDHVQIGGDRYNVRWKGGNRPRDDAEKIAEIDRLREAWEALRAKPATADVTDVRLWLRSYLVDYHGVNAAKL
jgi:hypothetical protein